MQEMQGMIDIYELLDAMYEMDGSDLHLVVGDPPTVRLHGGHVVGRGRSSVAGRGDLHLAGIPTAPSTPLALEHRDVARVAPSQRDLA
jgi:hypothetical protein